MTEINAMAKTGFDRAFYATKALIDDKRVFLAKYRINGEGRKVKVYRTTEHLKLTEDADPPEPEPDAVAKKKEEKEGAQTAGAVERRSGQADRKSPQGVD